MKFAAIAGWVEQKLFPINFMCDELGVSRAGYYKWRNRTPSLRDVTDDLLRAEIQDIHGQARGNPGVRRTHAGLRARGWRVAAKRVWRLMRDLGLKGRHPRAWKRTTMPGESVAPAPDLIGRDFTADAVNTRWCGDITYVKTWRGWAYMATVIDLYSRKLVGWAIASHMETGLITQALDMVINDRKPAAGIVFHSDRGCQYTSNEFALYCLNNNIRRSVGRTGICYDNAVSESFFATFKKELIHTRPWPDMKRLEAATRDWIDNYYNAIRRHSTLGYLTPVEFELGYAHIDEIAA